MNTSEEKLKPIWVTVRQACQLGGFQHVTCYNLIKIGRLKTAKVGKRRLISYESIEKLGEA